MSITTYRCKDCGKEVSVKAGSPTPDCCGKRMDQLPLDPCTHPHAAEAAMPGKIDDACDDGVH